MNISNEKKITKSIDKSFCRNKMRIFKWKWNRKWSVQPFGCHVYFWPVWSAQVLAFQPQPILKENHKIFSLTTLVRLPMAVLTRVISFQFRTTCWRSQHRKKSPVRKIQMCPYKMVSVSVRGFEPSTLIFSKLFYNGLS